MRALVRCWCLVAISISVMTAAQAREWGFLDEQIVLEAEIFSFNEDYVVLQRADGELVLLAKEELSASNREFLNSQEAVAINHKNIYSLQTWTIAGNVKLVGRIVDFQHDDLTIHRRRGHTYVNDRRFTNLPEFYRQLLPLIIEHFEEIELPNEQAMHNWLRSLRNRPRTFSLNGVVLELENGDEYAIPFFAFNDEDRKLLKSGWSNWLTEHENFNQRNALAFRLETLAAAHFQNQEIKHDIALMNLNLQAIRAGLTSAWEVTLYPAIGNPSPPLWVVTMGRNSVQATNAALAENPGFIAGPVRRVSR